MGDDDNDNPALRKKILFPMVRPIRYWRMDFDYWFRHKLGYRIRRAWTDWRMRRGWYCVLHHEFHSCDWMKKDRHCKACEESKAGEKILLGESE